MNNFTGTKKEDGFLVGVIIALIVILVGGVAVFGLVGNLMSGSGDSKARYEAKELGLQKIEELRNVVEIAKFKEDFLVDDPDVIIASSTPETIDGVNAQFKREWTICKVTQANYDCQTDLDDPVITNLRKINMQVSFVDPKDPLEADGTTEKRKLVLLNSFIAFLDPAKIGIAGTADETGSAAPGTDRSAIERAEDDTTQHEDLDSEPGGVAGAIGEIGTGINSKGNLIVYQGELTNENVKLTVFGGIILKFEGTLYYDDGDVPFIRATSPSFCEFLPFDPLAVVPIPGPPSDPSEEDPWQTWRECSIYDAGTGLLNCGIYWCAASGDCSNETETSITDKSPDADDCKKGLDATGTISSNLSDTDLIDHLNDIKALGLNGGWYGKIGVLFPDIDAPGQIPRVCMGDWPVYFDSGIAEPPARFKVTERTEFIDSDNILVLLEYEGINQSLSECNFLAADQSGQDTCDQTAYDNELDIENFSLRDIRRSLTPEAINTVQAPGYCSVAPSCNCIGGTVPIGLSCSSESCSIAYCDENIKSPDAAKTYNLSCPAPCICTYMGGGAWEAPPPTDYCSTCDVGHCARNIASPVKGQTYNLRCTL